MAKTWMSIYSKMVDFWTHFWFLSSNIALLGPWKNLKSFPVIAQDIKKKEKINIAFFCQKFLDSIFWTSKMAKTRMSIWPKMVNFWTHFRFLSSNIALLGSWKNLKSFPLIAKEILKKMKKKFRVFHVQIFGKVNTPTQPPTHPIKWSISGGS